VRKVLKFLKAIAVIGVLITQVSRGANPNEVKSTTPHPLSLSAIYKIIEESKKVYVINLSSKLEIPREQYMDQMYPLDSKPPMYIAKDKDGYLKSVNFSKECTENSLAGFDLLKGKNNLESIELFDKALKADSSCYMANIGKGHALYYMQRQKESILQYEKAISANPLDYQGHFYAANNYYHLGNNEKAIIHYIKTLAIVPSHAGTMNALKQNYKSLGVELIDLKFQPHGFVRKQGEKIEVYFPKEEPEWSAWALSKAIWMGEPEFRKQHLGGRESFWSSMEEAHSLTNLITIYESRKDKSIKNPDIEKIAEIARAGYLNEYAVYFMGSRLSSIAGMALTEEQSKRLEEFVAKYIVINTRKL
jgi:tetratricopeptide (TPR) repeat protein